MLCYNGSKQKDNKHLVEDANSVSPIGYKQKKQSAKILQSNNKGVDKSSKVSGDTKHKKNSNKESQHLKIFNSASRKTNESKISSAINSEVNNLISNSTISIIEKSCIEDLNRKTDKESESWKEDCSDQKGNLNLGNTQRKYLHDTLN